MAMSEAVRLENISKQFGQIQALEDISFSVEENEVMAVIGDNGAGKSTLIKIISGVLQQSSGDIYINGKGVDFSNYNDAERVGIETVYQDLAIAPNRTVAENIFLGNEIRSNGLKGKLLRFLDDKRMVKESAHLLSQLQLDLNPKTEVKNFSGGNNKVSRSRGLFSRTLIS